jgi:hypothetical protein
VGIKPTGSCSGSSSECSCIQAPTTNE